MKLFNTVFFALICTGISYSQESDTLTKESSAIRIKPSFGFNLGVDYSLVNNYSSNISFASFPTTVYNAPGFRLGVFGDIKIQERFTLIPRGELSFNYSTAQQNGVTVKLDPFILDFMLHSKWNFLKRNRNTKVNPYCYLGPAIRVPVNPLNGNSEDYYDTKSAWSGDVAFGLDIDLGLFYFSPEIRLSAGLSNIKKEDSWEKLSGSYTALVFNFTGK